MQIMECVNQQEAFVKNQISKPTKKKKKIIIISSMSCRASKSDRQVFVEQKDWERTEIEIEECHQNGHQENSLP